MALAYKDRVKVDETAFDQQVQWQLGNEWKDNWQTDAKAGDKQVLSKVESDGPRYRPGRCEGNERN